MERPNTAPLSREEIAQREIGRTGISSRSARGLTIVFLSIVFTVPLGQHLAELRAGLRVKGAWAWPQCYDMFRRVAAMPGAWREAGGPFTRRLFHVNALLLRDIHAYEDALEENSWLTRAVLPPAQYVLLRWFGVGNEQAYRGLDGWLFYRPEIEYLSGPGFLDPRQIRRRAASGSEWRAPPQPDPLPAILAFHEQLRARGVELIVMPTPVKPSVHPDRFTRACAGFTGALQNASYQELLDRLRSHGVRVFDPSALLKETALRDGQPQFLATDTHWRPEAMERVAERLAGFIQALPGWGDPPQAAWRRDAVEVTNTGDIAGMLQLPARARPAPETVMVHPVFSARNELWRSSESASALLLGDSFSNIYSLQAMGWGAGAGLAEQLSFFLGAPVDRLVRNDEGAYATRRMLSRELARGRDRLAGKRVIVWQFSARELAVGDWQHVAMTPGPPRPARFVSVPPGQSWMVTGEVAAVTAVPRPGSVPYKDHILSVWLTGLSGVPGQPEGEAEALVFLWSMRDNELQPAAYLRGGQPVRLRLRAWSDVAAEYEAINRTESDDPALQLEEPCWGELLE